MEHVNNILEKYNHFKEAQIRYVTSSSDSSKIVTFVIQDDDGEDLNSVDIEFKGIKEAKILQNSVLPMMDMMSGITLIKEHGFYGFALGSGTAMLHVHNAPLYIISSSVEIEEK